MAWNCQDCGRSDGRSDKHCSYCFGELVDNCNRYREYKRLGFTSEELQFNPYRNETSMTPQEQLFSDLFNHEKILVKDMDTLTLRAHREELAHIAFEARARLTAVDDEDKTRKKTTGPSGFAKSINTDESTTNAINGIKERQKRLTAKEKVEAGLVKLYQESGHSLDAAKLLASKKMGNQAVLAIVQNVEELKSDKTNVEIKESKPIFNPFEKK